MYIRTKDGYAHYIEDLQGFMRLVSYYMGRDAERYLRSYTISVKNITEEVDKLTKKELAAKLKELNNGL